jgi:hypothetical protein
MHEQHQIIMTGMPGAPGSYFEPGSFDFAVLFAFSFSEVLARAGAGAERQAAHAHFRPIHPRYSGVRAAGCFAVLLRVQKARPTLKFSGILWG